MESLFLFIAAAIMLMALEVGDRAGRRGVREIRIVPITVRNNLTSDDATVSASSDRYHAGANQ